jgi:hypothetical protein
MIADSVHGNDIVAISSNGLDLAAYISNAAINGAALTLRISV